MDQESGIDVGGFDIPIARRPRSRTVSFAIFHSSRRACMDALKVARPATVRAEKVEDASRSKSSIAVE
jgi:hypothetical protein